MDSIYGLITIYKITSPTNKIYIGQSWDWGKRISNYRRLDCINQPKLYNSIKKYGFEAHKTEILLILPKTIAQKSLDFYEIYWWKHYKDFGFNMLNVKEPGSHGKHSEETKMKMKGNIPSLETRLKISKKLTGRKIPKEVGEKISKANMGRKMSEKTKIALLKYNKLPKSLESIEKMIKSLTGRKLSEETKEKMKNRWKREIIILDKTGNFIAECNSIKDATTITKDSHNSIYGLLNNTRNKRVSAKGYQFIDKCKYNISENYTIINSSLPIPIPVLQYSKEGEFIKEYPSINSICKITGFDWNGISRCCKNKIKTYKNYIFKYKL